MCPQIDMIGSSHSEIHGDEDCLYLNVFTPKVRNSIRDALKKMGRIFKINLHVFQLLDGDNAGCQRNLLPVMFSIPGGAFLTGSSNTHLYNPRFLLEKDVILVTTNYRLGILGFLSTGDSASPGNYGLKDIVLALKWVKKNIRAFGGDPERVTIFGESAGGAAVDLLALSDATSGTFHQIFFIKERTDLRKLEY